MATETAIYFFLSTEVLLSDTQHTAITDHSFATHSFKTTTSPRELMFTCIKINLYAA